MLFIGVGVRCGLVSFGVVGGAGWGRPVISKVMLPTVDPLIALNSNPHFDLPEAYLFRMVLQMTLSLTSITL